tara:strand:- start:939 stop:1148 length:210 start_codon:yes stop_codon:yes gene_type:complete
MLERRPGNAFTVVNAMTTTSRVKNELQRILKPVDAFLKLLYRFGAHDVATRYMDAIMTLINAPDSSPAR